jgi:hypothetical protein
MAAQDVHLVKETNDDRPICGRELNRFRRSVDIGKVTCRECLLYFAHYGRK